MQLHCGLFLCDLFRKLTKAKGPAGAKEEEKPKGLTLFGRKPPTPKLLKAFANLRALKGKDVSVHLQLLLMTH